MGNISEEAKIEVYREALQAYLEKLGRETNFYVGKDGKLQELANKLIEEQYSELMCEWIAYDYRTMCPKNHDVANPYWRIPVDMDKLKYCPYCGKKIKYLG